MVGSAEEGMRMRLRYEWTKEWNVNKQDWEEGLEKEERRRQRVMCFA
jgi:hypothetical protein